MKTHLENDIRHSERRHPVDFLEPLPNDDGDVQRVREALSRTFGWVAEGNTVEQKGLRVSIVLYCVRADLIGAATLEELGALVGFPQSAVSRLVTDFRHTIGWK